ncbi:MAG: amidophosphoribosyltransferase [Christensenella sp.]|nr:amidophosphoribosyltransferase [Christensenella sp.]
MQTKQLKEECGIFGIYNKENIPCIGNLVYYGLFALQHRGQEAAGIAVNINRDIYLKKNLGLVSEVFASDNSFLEQTGNIAVGHVRYSTCGGNILENAQPISVRYAKGNLTICHNGNIYNAQELRQNLENEGAIFHTTSDSEVICYLIARERLHCSTVEEAVKNILPKLKGSFSLLVMSPEKLIALRDPYGFRPLCMGELDNSIVFSSESCALETIGATYKRDVKPGEIIVVSKNGISYDTSLAWNQTGLCIFEHIYFARPDSIIDGQSVQEARTNAGKLLARQYPIDADIVIGVPDSGLAAAQGYAEESGIKYGVGLIKNRYIGRTFIQPTQALREKSVALKLNTLSMNIKDKKVVMIDDSIVRGTTLANIIKLLKKSGAKEVHVRVASPKFMYPCYFGTDIPSRDQLACNKWSEEELRKKIGADSLGFLKLETVKQIAPNSKVDFCTGCFSGIYPGKIYSE